MTMAFFGCTEVDTRMTNQIEGTFKTDPNKQDTHTARTYMYTKIGKLEQSDWLVYPNSVHVLYVEMPNVS